jgi:hypothetical protein
MIDVICGIVVKKHVCAVPFANTLERDVHFTKHGHKFGATDASEYERMADVFMFGLMGVNTHECIRPRNIDRLRFDFGTHYEGVACISPEFVRTFYPVERRFILRRGGERGYFTHECSRTSL